MKHRFILCLIALILCCACCLPASAEYDTPDAWNLTFETDDVIAAAKEVCLIYGGLGIWEKGQVQTVGCVVLEQNESDDKIELALYTARSVFDCSSGSPERIAGGLKPVKLIFEKEGNGLRLLSYQKPEDGAENAASRERIFGKALHLDIAKRQSEYTELALQDAAEDADDYMTYLQTNKRRACGMNSFLLARNPKRGKSFFQLFRLATQAILVYPQNTDPVDCTPCRLMESRAILAF